MDNFGVGNYGADQALILSKKIMKKNHYKISILGIVPETILRIHSMWKHYYEYNNLFGFKPRFIIKKKLYLIKNKINSFEKFKTNEKKLNEIKKHDYFYKTVFKKEIITKPFLLSYLRSTRNIKLLFYIFFKEDNKTLQKFVIKKTFF